MLQAQRNRPDRNMDPTRTGPSVRMVAGYAAQCGRYGKFGKYVHLSPRKLETRGRQTHPDREKRRQRHQHRFHRYPDHRPEKHGRLAFPPTGNECPGFRQTAPINPQTDTDEHERCPAQPDRCILHTPFTTVCHSSGQHSINPSATTESDIFPIRTNNLHT